MQVEKNYFQNNYFHVFCKNLIDKYTKDFQIDESTCLIVNNINKDTGLELQASVKESFL